MPPVVIRGPSVDVDAIHAAIRARIAARRSVAAPAGAAEIEARLAERTAKLADWNFPAPLWQAMWPPALEPWNLDEDWPIRSHRGGVGRPLVALKRVWRAVLRLLARPLLVRQVEINRALALMTWTLARELVEARQHTLALEARLARTGEIVRESLGEVEPLVRFEDPAP